MTKYLLNIKNQEDGLNYSLDYKTLEEAKKALQKKLKWESQDGCKVEKIDEYHYHTFDPVELSITTYSIVKYQKKYNNDHIPTKRISIKFVPEYCPFYLKDPNKFKNAPKYYLCHYDKKSDTAHYCLNDNEYTTIQNI